MIRQIVKNRVSFALSAIAAFALAYILRINLAIPVLLFSLFFYFKYRVGLLKGYKLLHLVFLFVVVFVLSFVIIRNGWQFFYLPYSLAPLLTVLLFGNLEISLLLTVTTALCVASITGNNLYLGLMFITSGIISSMLVYGARTRMSVIRVGLIVGISQAVILFFINRFWMGVPAIYLMFVLNGIVTSIVVLGILPLFEYLFGTVTNISLLELADFHHPLLQQMVLEAPGTYHHSLIVGNLSEAACNSVAANALLARIGAYYHDIGKLQKPDYFSENQGINESRHASLSPTMSKMVIMNHVKDGIELARKYRLNPKIIEFVQQHHGTSLVYYFYRRALENLEEDQEVLEEGFRYPGPRPKSKETAIVLLADSVEAATRSLKEPTPKRIEELVRKIINNKFIDKQLDECDLTLNDLDKIAAVFIHILSGIYHSRITYPEENKDSENNGKKSSKEGPRQPEADTKDDS